MPNEPVACHELLRAVGSNLKNEFSGCSTWLLAVGALGIQLHHQHRPVATVVYLQDLWWLACVRITEVDCGVRIRRYRR